MGAHPSSAGADATRTLPWRIRRRSLVLAFERRSSPQEFHAPGEGRAEGTSQTGPEQSRSGSHHTIHGPGSVTTPHARQTSSAQPRLYDQKQRQTGERPFSSARADQEPAACRPRHQSGHQRRKTTVPATPAGREHGRQFIQSDHRQVPGADRTDELGESRAPGSAGRGGPSHRGDESGCCGRRPDLRGPAGRCARPDSVRSPASRETWNHRRVLASRRSTIRSRPPIHH